VQEAQALRIVGVSELLFAATLVAIGTLGVVHGDFAPIWEPVPKGVPAREALVYLCAFVSIGAGVGLNFRRAAATSARALLALLLIWMLAFRVPPIVRAPFVAVTWEGWGETAVITAAAWVLHARFVTDWDRRHVGFAAGEPGLRWARTLYGLALISLGVAHIVYVKETASLVPGWLPWHVGWAYATGFAYIAAGLAVLTGLFARLAAALSALQMGGFTLLVWGPVLVAGPRNAFEWNESIVSWALTIGGWVVADSYRGTRWLAPHRR
jgi:uncharacterized membrane protein